ncbi:MAG: beta-lactamase family protein, partial [Gemmatimonadota bacterium]|nr:beta-lactamase family protein [Gemmatimonadota bacterium]
MGTLFVSLVLLCFGSGIRAQALRPAAPEEVGMSSDRLHRLDRALTSYVESGRLPGGVILVARDGRVVHRRAFGWRDLEERDAMEGDDLFRIASQTKALVSVAAMLLMEEGSLLLNDPVGKFIPSFRTTLVAEAREGGGYDVVPAHRPITVRDLLTHTSGVAYGGGVG